MRILEYMQKMKQEGRKGLAILIDPDRTGPKKCRELAEKIKNSGISFVLVGSSLLLDDNFQEVVSTLKKELDVPVVIFPGNVFQISESADALLFLSLISGRNPEMLIGNHVLAAPKLRKANLEVIPTGYILVDTGKDTAVNYMSNTRPIPYDQSDIAVCTAMAGELLGLKLIYLEGGSGARVPLSTEMVKAVAASVEVPLIVGGGIKTKAQAEQLYQAGADLLVVGSALENSDDFGLLAGISELLNHHNDIQESTYSSKK